jgi:hypothetical protein
MTYSRYTLIPEEIENKNKLVKLNGLKSVAPLDSYLGLAGLPFKITPYAMLKIAYWAQNQNYGGLVCCILNVRNAVFLLTVYKRRDVLWCAVNVEALKV